ncbi:MAG: M3 family metallopeptidase [Proteobacteria bacterium]|nr:M3 family metallopeptidase [Pseudomonadota bacterium]
MTVHPNPLLAPWTAPFGLPPFDAIRACHFEPALHEAMRQHLAELDAIAAQGEPPTFDNTAAALDRAGALLERVRDVLDVLNASTATPELQAVELAMAAPLAAHDSAVMMHAGVFARLDAVYQDRAALAPEARRLVERLHLDRVRAGACFGPAEQARYAQLMQELAELTTRFAQNVLADEAAFERVLGPDDLAGLPAFVLDAAEAAAAQRGHAPGTRVVTLARSLIEPVLTFAERPELREAIWRAWQGRGEQAGPHDNRPIAQAILTRRLEQARLHGHTSYADYALADSMASEQAAVGRLLGEVWRRALPQAERERQALIAMMRSHGLAGEPAPWDWRYWSDKVRQARYAVDETQIKPYFELSRITDAAFDCAQRLFGITLVPRTDVPLYHPDVRAYEVKDAAGASLGVFLHDNFARPGKRSGAWMSALALQSANRAQPVRIILNNNNFARGTPTLLSLDDARTLFHEFGHGLHGLLSQVTYHRLAATQVAQDFVELPSQLFEHWLTEPEVLRRHARHWQTGEPLPAALLDKLQAAKLWGQAYATVAYTGSALVDLQLHAQTDAAAAADVVGFERETLAQLGMPPAIGVRHRLPHFLHLFGGDDYASAYYVYLWAEVLDADAFNAFVEAGDAFDPATAERLRRCIYAAGNTRAPAEAYQAFRGRAAQLEPLLAKRGLLTGAETAP